MFATAKRIGHGLFGGMFDGQPGAFSQHQGGLSGLLGSFADGQAGNALFGAPQASQAVSQNAPQAVPQNDWQAMVQMAEAPAQRPTVSGKSVPQAQAERPKKDGPGFWRTFDDVLGGMTVSESRDAHRARAAAEGQRAAMMEMASRVIQDPREWMVFASDPEAWAKENAERFGSDVLSQGQMLTHGGQTVNAAPIVEKFDDRFGYLDLLTGQNGFTAPRGPTFSEETDATKALADIEAQIQELNLKRQQLAETARHNRASEGLADRQERRMASPPSGGGGSALENMSDEQLLQLLGQ